MAASVQDRYSHLALSTALTVHRLRWLIDGLPNLKTVNTDLWSVHCYHCAVALSDSHHGCYGSTMPGLEAHKISKVGFEGRGTEQEAKVRDALFIIIIIIMSHRCGAGASMHSLT